MDAVINHLKGHAAQLDHGWAHPRLGIVTSVDSQTYSARVTIQPEGVLTGWLPIAAGWTGNNWGMVCAPSPGDQVVVLWQEGDAEQGLVAGRIWSNVATPPVAPAGEFWLVHRSGSCLKLHNDGSIESGGTVWHHNGDLRVSGDVYDNHGPMSGLRAHYNEHTHPPSDTPPTSTD